MANGFIWYELMTTDPEGAKAFYRAVIGWETQDLAAPHDGYTLLNADGRGVAGLMAQREAARAEGAPAAWFGYVSVPDANSAATSIEQAGGRILRSPDDIPDVGRFAVVADPGGAAFMLLTPTPRGDVPPPQPRMTPGHVGWHELYAEDGDLAFAFYKHQFGWAETSTMDMGPMGTYRLWSASEGGETVGGMMTKPAQAPKAMWLFYFVVDSVEAAAARIGEAGGTVRLGPMQVPDGSWVVQAHDPQGAMFALVSQHR